MLRPYPSKKLEWNAKGFITFDPNNIFKHYSIYFINTAFKHHSNPRDVLIDLTNPNSDCYRSKFIDPLLMHDKFFVTNAFVETKEISIENRNDKFLFISLFFSQELPFNRKGILKNRFSLIKENKQEVPIIYSIGPDQKALFVIAKEQDRDGLEFIFKKTFLSIYEQPLKLTEVETSFCNDVYLEE